MKRRVARPTGTRAKDGRVERGRQTRDAVLDAALDEIYDGGPLRAAAYIAHRAEVSLRALRKYFPTHESLVLETVRCGLASVAAQLPPPPPAKDAKLRERVGATVKHRSQVLELAAPVWGLALQYEEEFATLRKYLASVRAEQRAELARTFAQELKAEGSEQEVLLDALEFILSASSWVGLLGPLTRYGSSSRNAGAVMERSVLGLLSP